MVSLPGWPVCSMANDSYVSSSPEVKSARRVLTPAVSSHSVDHSVSLRPLACSRLERKSASSALRHAYLRKYCRSPSRKASWPTQATSCFSVDAPLR